MSFPQGNYFGRETRFLLTPIKLLSLCLWLNILLVTQKLVRLYHFVIFFKKTMQAAAKTHQLPGVILEIEGSVQAALV